MCETATSGPLRTCSMSFSPSARCSGAIAVRSASAARPNALTSVNRAAPAPESGFTAMRESPAERLNRSVSARTGQSASRGERHSTTPHTSTVLRCIGPPDRNPLEER